MSFVASSPMGEPEQDSMPSQANKGDRNRNQKKNGRASSDHQQQQQPQLQPQLSSPSSMPAKPNGSHLADSETISNASLGSSKSSRRRRRGRGGRKNRSKHHIASQQLQDEAGLAGTPDGSQSQQFQDAEKELYGYGGDLSDSYQGERDEGERNEEQHPDESGKASAEQGHPGHHHHQQEQQAKQPSKTGIRAFNVRRSDPKGGRPVGMRAQRNSKRTATQDHGGHDEGPSEQQIPEKQEQPQQPETQQTRIPRISVKQTPRQEPGHKPGQEDEKGPDQEEPQEKEFSIKIDLNLELVIAFKVKVKGEIMLTFLE